MYCRPLLMLLCPFFLLYLVPMIMERYDFQEPILKTKLFTIQHMSQGTLQNLYLGQHPSLLHASLQPMDSS